MRIILLEDVYKLGVAGEVVKVAPGYARNFLIPRSLAVKVTPGALRQSETLRESADTRRADRDKEYSKIAEKIEELTLYFGVKAGETGKLYGSVTPVEIAEKLNEEISLEIDRRRVGDNPLRELGTFRVPVRLEANLVPTVKVVVFREGEDPRLVKAVAEEEAEEAVELEEAEIEMPEVEAEAELEAEAEAVEEIEEASEEAPAE
ncbi:MAG: 50S ribosomal protein L9 [Anaerolineae bacterium]|nr:50S ribosomal protein L9 [Anaerolineae bacterium]